VEESLLIDDRDPVLLFPDSPIRSRAGELQLDWMLDGVLLRPVEGEGLFIKEAAEEGDRV
jgi:hypothetical protein